MTRALLHDYYRSSAAYRVRIALNLKGVDYDRLSVNLAEGEQKAGPYRALNPQGFVPMLEIDGLKLTQSLAIAVYLDQTRPEPPLMPRDPADGAHVRSLAMTIACDIHPINNLRVLKYLKSELGQEQAAVDRWYAHWVREGLAPLEAIARTRACAFLFGCAAQPGTGPAGAAESKAVSILLFGDTGYDYDWLEEDDYEDAFTGREFVINELDDWIEDKRPIEEFSIPPMHFAQQTAGAFSTAPNNANAGTAIRPRGTGENLADWNAQSFIPGPPRSRPFGSDNPVMPCLTGT